MAPCSHNTCTRQCLAWHLVSYAVASHALPVCWCDLWSAACMACQRGQMYPLAVSLLVPCASVAGCCWCAWQRPCVHDSRSQPVCLPGVCGMLGDWVAHAAYLASLLSHSPSCLVQGSGGSWVSLCCGQLSRGGALLPQHLHTTVFGMAPCVVCSRISCFACVLVWPMVGSMYGMPAWSQCTHWQCLCSFLVHR